nr:uncharacterized protein LOC109157656 [Ipomoea trifida]
MLIRLHHLLLSTTPSRQNSSLPEEMEAGRESSRTRVMAMLLLRRHRSSPLPPAAHARNRGEKSCFVTGRGERHCRALPPSSHNTAEEGRVHSDSQTRHHHPLIHAQHCYSHAGVGMPQLAKPGSLHAYASRRTQVDLACSLAVVANQYDEAATARRPADIYSFGIIILEVISARSSSSIDWGLRRTTEITSGTDGRTQKYETPLVQKERKKSCPKSTHNPSGILEASIKWSNVSKASFVKLGISQSLEEEIYLAAFLACWLCMFVLPSTPMRTIHPETFKMACTIASGNKNDKDFIFCDNKRGNEEDFDYFKVVNLDFTKHVSSACWKLINDIPRSLKYFDSTVNMTINSQSKATFPMNPTTPKKHYSNTYKAWLSDVHANLLENHVLDITIIGNLNIPADGGRTQEKGDHQLVAFRKGKAPAQRATSSHGQTSRQTTQKMREEQVRQQSSDEDAPSDEDRH